MLLLSFLALSALTSLSEAVRCYECRSDIHRSCGDPFVPVSVPSVECSQLSTNPVIMCYKASQSVGIGNQHVTVRGCAPFDTETFGHNFQRGMQGTYWNGRNSFSLCDHNNCNGSEAVIGSYAVFLTTLIAILIL